MNRRRLRHDLGHLVTWCLLLLALATIGTGIVADMWDLNGFRLHRLTGYGMALAALVHVALSWRRLTAYARFRLRHLRRGLRSSAVPAPGGATADAAPQPAQGPSAETLSNPHTVVGTSPRAAASSAPRRGVTRRGLIGAAAAGTVGVVAGRGLRPTPPVPGGADLGVVYHEWSKPGVLDALGSLASLGRRPPPSKSYPDAPTMALPAAPLAGGMPFADVLARRRSERAYDDQPLTLDELARLLRWTDGRREGSRRTSPSAGALYPLELYPIVHGVEGLEPGVYHYDVATHGLALVRPGEVRSEVARLGWNQDFLGAAGVVLAVTLVFQRLRFKYGDRTYRYGMLEAGHVGQNAYLAATALGLGACAVGAFRDDDLDALLDVDGTEEAAVYLVSVGRVATSRSA